VIPPDASSRLATLSNSLPKHSLKRKLATYLSLAKPRLTFLIVLTATAAYSIYPVPSLLSPETTSAPSLSTVTLLYLTSGTFLTCASANAFNMLLEPEHDAKMSRTRNRPLVRNLLSKRAALLFAIGTGIVGSGALYLGTNPTTAALGAGNLILYAFIYTPLKRIHPINTWVGAIVGAIPPLMGWTAAAGLFASEKGDWQELLLGESSRGGWALAGLLFAWQIPHFAALSFSIRHEYAAAGFRMLCSSNPRLDALLSLLCAAACSWSTIELYQSGVIERWAAVLTVPLNAWLIVRAVQFRVLQGAKSSARNLFWASVWYLPGILVVCMFGKKGLMDRTWAWLTGQTLPLDDEDDWEWEAEQSEKSKGTINRSS
jgi:protoheme IX farnesyltransferase